MLALLAAPASQAQNKTTFLVTDAGIGRLTAQTCLTTVKDVSAALAAACRSRSTTIYYRDHLRFLHALGESDTLGSCRPFLWRFSFTTAWASGRRQAE